MGRINTKRQLKDCEVWKNAKPTAKVYVQRREGMVSYQVIYVTRAVGRYTDELNIVAKDAGVHNLPSMTIKALAIKGMTKDAIEQCSIFSKSSFNADIRADGAPIEDVKMLGDDIMLLTA